jgi:predicted O-linked N-acetylglucosamine transferase (SPINDLY family)
MDYFVTDPIQHPFGSSGDTVYADGYSESLLVLPRSSRCYQPLESAPNVGPIPCLKSGHVTFGSLNRPSKFNEPILQAWALLLRELPDAKLLMLVGDVNDAQASRLYGPLMKRNGIPMERLEWAGRRPVAKYLELYDRVDVALDTFPYNGCTTSCDALWMGVPLVTLAGKTMVSRVGASILHQVELDDLVSEMPEQYVETARSIALDVGRRKHMRSTLRSTMRSSSLVDATVVPLDLGSALREVWVRWCSSR